MPIPDRSSRSPCRPYSRRARRAAQALLSLLAVLASAGTARASTGGTHAVARPTAERPLELELLSAARALVPGDTVTVALRLRPVAGWHTYWRYAGDVGSAPIITWHLPPGYEATPPRWPAPALIASPPLASYGYEREVYLLSTIRVPRDARPGSSATLAAAVSWVACKVECVAGDVDLAVTLPVAAARRTDPATARVLAAAWARVPLQRADWRFSARADSAAIVLRIRPPAGVRLANGDTVRFFVDSAAVLDHAAPQTVRAPADGAPGVELVLRRSEYAAPTPPARLTGVLELRGRGAGPTSGATAPLLALEVNAPVASAATGATMATTLAGAAPGGARIGLAVAALLALLGGTLLNLMPCVLPVLSIKALGLAEAAGRDAASARRHAALFAAGVLVSMWALVALLLALRAAGAEIGWGFQLQSPAVVGALALLVFAAALNLMGVFELSPVGGGALAAAAGRRSRGAEAFLSGVLVTALATPCSAPFLAAAVAYGVAAGALPALVVFTALGAGLVWPVGMVALVPGARRLLPRPGAWMLTLRQLLAFPLLATVVWLAWVLGHQAGADAVAALLAALTVLALGLWALGRFGAPVASGRARVLAHVVAACAIAGAVAVVARLAPGAPARRASGSSAVHSARGAALPWIPYDADTVAALRARGRVVLLDFTADWCLTCKVNERVAFASSAVRAAVREHDVAVVRADWTSRDPAVTRALAAFGRNSVPFAVLYPPSPSAAPAVLPTILTPGIVVRAIDAAAGAAAVAPHPPSTHRLTTEASR